MTTASIDSNTKIETGIAIVGGIIAAVGAVTVATVPMIIGAATVAAAAAFRLMHTQKSPLGGGTDTGRTEPPQRVANPSPK